jgi:AraC-like DNA-binding protein
VAPSHSLDVLHRSPGLYVGRFRCSRPEGDQGGEEAAPADALVFPRRGAFVKHAAGRRVVATPQRLLLLRRGERYRISHPLPGGDDSLVLSLRARDLAEIAATRDPSARDRGEALPAESRPCPPGTALLRDELLAALRRPAGPLEAAERAHALVGSALDVPDLPPAPAGRAARRQRELACDAELLLARRYREAVGLAGLSRELGAASFHLCRVFRRETGWPLHAYLLGLRLREALARLADGERDLAALAASLGFADHSHLTRTFRRHFGLTPSAFRGQASSRALAALSARSPGASRD